MINNSSLSFSPHQFKRVGCLLLLLICVSPCLPFLFRQLPPVRHHEINRLDYVVGEVEPVFLAGDGWSSPVLSPDGKWLAVIKSGWLQGKGELGVMDTESYELYSLPVSETASPRWIDQTHLLVGSTMIRLPDMASWQVQRRPLGTDALAFLGRATSIVALDGRLAAGSLLVSTDPQLPYVLPVSWQGQELGQNLAGLPYRIIPAELWRPYRDESNARLYSPDGRYFISGGDYSAEEKIFYPQPAGDWSVMQHPNSLIFEAKTGKMVAVARKYGWGTVVLGWAPDSSGVYLQFIPLRWAFGERPTSFPTYKLLVPGQQPGQKEIRPAETQPAVASSAS